MRKDQLTQSTKLVMQSPELVMVTRGEVPVIPIDYDVVTGWSEYQNQIAMAVNFLRSGCPRVQFYDSMMPYEVALQAAAMLAENLRPLFYLTSERPKDLPSISVQQGGKVVTLALVVADQAEKSATPRPYGFGEMYDEKDPSRSIELCPELGCGEKAEMRLGEYYYCPKKHEWYLKDGKQVFQDMDD